jgi:hypothetical protein
MFGFSSLKNFDMDTADLIDRIRSLRERVESPAQATSFDEVTDAATTDEAQVNAAKPDDNLHAHENSSQQSDDEVFVLELEPKDQSNGIPILNKDTTANNNADNNTSTSTESKVSTHSSSSRIANNLSAALSALDDDRFETLAAKGQIDQLALRMEILEGRLKKTQDMILTLNRSVGRLIQQEEDIKALHQTERTVLETIQSPVAPSAATADDDIITLDRMVKPAPGVHSSPDHHPSNEKFSYRQKSASKPRPKRRLFGIAAMILTIGIGYILFGFGSTTSQPASILPETDAFLNDNERAVFAHIEMGMARPLGITSVTDFSSRMREKGINLPEYYTCLIGALDVSTKPMNEMMTIQLLDNPLRADFNPGIIDRMKARFESRYGSADHYGGFGRAASNLDACRNW